ncbi:hypothetical protein GCM10007424_23510 [Flavobacterium suaedae]|uniref:Uncharacterized protein n=1 Tax=Flavobacterium suaedae TaxID=1767027 RepID=A0ABQ1K2V2_9FLAO|nr:hypothetical protein [Flavobacterium suaedae]GGB82770.1 hypothetical protein GCM10007424_23510 [Flavobacterium suaedae]
MSTEIYFAFTGDRGHKIEIREMNGLQHFLAMQKSKGDTNKLMEVLLEDYVLINGASVTVPDLENISCVDVQRIFEALAAQIQPINVGKK